MEEMWEADISSHVQD